MGKTTPRIRTEVVVLEVLLVSLIFSLGLTQSAPASASFEPSKAAYYDRVKNAFSLTPEQQEALEDNGFIIVDTPRTSDTPFRPELRFEEFYYSQVYGNDLPVFVTTDSILHLFHVVFDCSLKMIENGTFYPLLLEVTEFGFNKALEDYNQAPHDQSIRYWATRNSTIYFGVALSLLRNQTVEVPSELLDDLTFFLDKIWSDDLQFLRYAGKWIVPGVGEVEVEYDFTQFKVRGHYLGDVQLERYFRTFMWYGQFPIFLPRNDEEYLWNAPSFDPAVVVHMRDIVRPNAQYFDKWMLLYNVTSDLVGESDSINLLNLETALERTFGKADTYLDCVSTEAGLAELTEELGKPEYGQQILSQALVVENPGAVLPRYPLIFQFMGQRYVPDSYVFQMLCWDKVGFGPSLQRRVMPKGIDVFAALGSERAYQLLIPDFVYADFEKNLESLKAQFNNFTAEDWTQSSYLAWIHCLEGLVNVEHGGDYPDFMRTLAWQDEKLNTALASWAQLRHGTLLYAKQTYIPGLTCSYPEAFVEPYPVFYARMQELSQRTIDALAPLNSNGAKLAIMEALQTMKDVATKLEVISTKELSKQALTQEEVQFLKEIAWQCGSGGFIGWYADTIHAIADAAHSESILDVPVIADVATFPPGDMDYPPQILHVGTGNVKALIVLFPKPDGTLVASVGPVFSYHEFRLIGTERLNDEEWKQMLALENSSTYLPDCFGDLYGKGEPWPIPEYVGTVPLVMVIAFCSAAVVVVWARRTRARRQDLLGRSHGQRVSASTQK